METDVAFLPTNDSDCEEKPLVHIIEPMLDEQVPPECATVEDLITQQDVSIKIEEDIFETTQNILKETCPETKTGIKILFPNVSLKEEPPLKISKIENDEVSLSSVMSKTPCVLRRTAKNELITANGGIILNDESPVGETKPKDPGMNSSKAFKNRHGEPVPHIFPKLNGQSIVLVTGDGLAGKNAIIYANGLKTGPRKRSVTKRPKLRRKGQAIQPKNVVQTEPIAITPQPAVHGIGSLARSITPGNIVIKPESVPANIKAEPKIAAMRLIKTTTENGDIIIKQEPILSTVAAPVVPKIENAVTDTPMRTIAIKSVNGDIIIKQVPVVNQEPMVKQEQHVPMVFSHKSWNGIGSCGPADESQQITTTVSVTHHKAQGDTVSNLVMCIKCKQIFTSMTTLNDHLKKTNHGDVNSYLYSNRRWREIAHQKKQEILEACQGKAWVCPTPSHLSFGPVIPEDQLPENIFKCKVCGGIYYNELEFQIHESQNSCNTRKKLQESLLQQFESKPIDKSLKKLL